MLPIKPVAEQGDLDWHTVKASDEAYLAQTLPPPGRTGVTKRHMGEVATSVIPRAGVAMR